MNVQQLRRNGLLVLLLVNAPIAAAAAEKGWFGIGMTIELAGPFWNPRVSSVSITHVIAGTPAAKGGVAVGDVLLEVDGIPVPGAKGKQLEKLQAMLEKPPAVGQKREMKLRRAGADGKTYSVVLVAEPRPPQVPPPRD
jgi:C-terminal processing protease CtpA/Prc